MFTHCHALTCPTSSAFLMPWAARQSHNLPNFYKQSRRGSGPNPKWNWCVNIENKLPITISVKGLDLSPFPFTLIIKTLLWHENDIIILKLLHFSVLTQTFLFFCLSETCQVYLPLCCLQPFSWRKAERIKAPGFCVFRVFMCWMVVNHINDSRNFLLEGLSSLTAHCSHHS